MKHRLTPCIVAPLALLALGCEKPIHEPEPIQAAAVTVGRDSGDDLDQRLLPSLAGRRSWNSKKVKVNLDQPELRVELANPSGQRRIVDAWSTNTTDARVPLVRVDWSEQLYEITPAEWASLRKRAGQ